MANNGDDLDDFFKKIDKKGNKHKKQPTILTNNEELLKQLVIVTSATSAFKENMDFDEDDDAEISVNNHQRHQLIDESNNIHQNNEDNPNNINKNSSKSTKKLSVQDNNNNINDQQININGQQDEWEEFEDPNSKYDKLRLKLSRNENDDDDDDYDENNHHTNFDGGDNDEQSLRNNRRREEEKDTKPVWKLDQINQIESNDLPIENIKESSVSKPATNAVYKPPQLRTNSSVTVVSGVNQRISKKEKPNLASTEEFPTLGATIIKK